MTRAPSQDGSPTPSPPLEHETSAASGSSADAARPRIGARAYVTTLASSLMIQVCTLLQGVLVARLLGPEGRGQLAAATLWPTLFAAVCLFGIDVAIARRAGKAPDLAALSRTAVALGGATSTVAIAASLLLIPVLLPSGERGLLSLALTAVLLIPINHLTLFLQAAELGAGRFGLLNLSRSVLYPVYLAALAVLYLSHLRSVGWVLAALIAASASALAVLIAARRRALFGRWTVERPGTLAREGLPYALAAIGTSLQLRIDQILLLWLLPVKDLGVYVVALSAASAVNSAAGAMSTVAFTRSAQASAREGFEMVARDFRRTAILSFGVAAVTIPALPFLLPLIYGGDFERATSIGMSLVAGSVFAGLSQLLDQALRAQGRPFTGLVARGHALLAMCIAGYVLTASLGLIGMAIAYVLSQFIGLVALARAAGAYYQDGPLHLLLPRATDARELVSAGRRLLSRLVVTQQGSGGGRAASNDDPARAANRSS